MKHGGNAGLSVLIGALLSASAMSLTSLGATSSGATSSPYSAIVERNVFNLHAPPPPGILPPPVAMPAPIPAPPPPGVQPMPNAGTVIRPLRSLPTRNSNPGVNGGLGAGSSGSANPQSQNSLTAEEQVALIELQRY